MAIRHRVTALVAVLLAIIAGLSTTSATRVSAASGPIFTVMNTSETLPDGVWFRYAPHTADTTRTTGLGVYKNERVQLECYAWGDAVGPYADRLWYFVLNVTRPTNNGVPNQGYLNAHYINDGKSANQVDAGVQVCGAKPTPPTVINGVDVGYPQNSPHSWGSNCVVQDFNGGPYGWVIVGYSNGTNIVRNGMLWGWFDNGGGPSLGCPTNQEHGYSNGVRQGFTHGSLFWAAGMDHAQRITWSDRTHNIWAGYAVSGSSINYVTGSWSVPRVSCANTHAASNAEFWVGLDGYVDKHHLIQAGFGASCSKASASPQYYIWQETNPNVPFKVAGSVAVGDRIQAIVTYAAGAYNIKIIVNGDVRLNRTAKLAGEPLTSAECIVESPNTTSGEVSPLANFGTSDMKTCEMATTSKADPVSVVNGQNSGLAVYRLNLVRNGVLRASTGLPVDGAWPVIWNAP